MDMQLLMSLLLGSKSEDLPESSEISFQLSKKKRYLERVAPFSNFTYQNCRIRPSFEVTLCRVYVKLVAPVV